MKTCPVKPAAIQRRLRPGQRGAASLVVVMVLFFLVSLVAAYTSRNLIFEQRTSVNQYRATQAFEAAQAGVEWATALLNGGRIGANCLEAGAAVTDTSFRQRYLNIDTGNVPATVGKITPAVLTAGAAPSCVWNGTAWLCQCPTSAAPTLTPPTGTGLFPAFRVKFIADGGAPAGVVRIQSNGCVRYDNACLNSEFDDINLEGRAIVTALIALKSAVPAPPLAALTVVGDVPAPALPPNALNAYNTDVGRGGVTVHAITIADPSSLGLHSTPGTPGTKSILLDPGLSGPPSAPPGYVFASTFGAWPAAYKLQPAAITTLSCPAGGCAAALATAVAMNPDRIVWIDGDLTLESAGDIGSLPNPADPTVPGPAQIVVTGQVHFLTPGVRVFGHVYSGDGNWSGSGEIQGAAFVESNFSATATPTLVYNPAVLDTLRLRSGSFVVVPGSWRDFFHP